MAKKPMTVQEKLAAARAGGPAKPEEEPISQSEREAGPPGQDPAELADLSAAPEPSEAQPPAAAPPPAPPQPTGRPLTLKEKLAAARAGGGAAVGPGAPGEGPGAATGRRVGARRGGGAGGAGRSPGADGPAVDAQGEAGRRPRGGGTAAPAGGAKPTAKAAPAAPAAKTASNRPLPPLEQMSDPKDLAEALRRTGAEKEAAAKATAAQTQTAAKLAAAKKVPESKVVPPRPSKSAAMAATQAETEPARAGRRGFLIGMSISAVVIAGWAAFTAGITAFSVMLLRFMFPNVLAEPPSTIKVGLPSNFEKGEVNERWKAEWGFWIVRSDAYNGIDTLYALQSVCTHLGCPPNWLGGEQKFKCPCHGSGFYISGVNFEGPAPRPLERFKVTLADDGQIIVDKSQKFQEELGQWSDPDSFIPVA